MEDNSKLFIGIIMDTNVLWAGKNIEDFNEVAFLKTFHPICKRIAEIGIPNVRFLFPKMVLDELYQQQCEQYEEKWKSNGLEHDNGTKDSYNKELQKKFDNCFKSFQYPVDVIDYPDKCSLHNIIDRAKWKRPPFAGKGKSDAGFKDVIIWESILQYKHKNKDDIIVFFSKDTGFYNQYLKDEYESKFSEELHIPELDAQKGSSEIQFKIFEDLSQLCEDLDIVAWIHKPNSSRIQDKLAELLGSNDPLFYHLFGDEFWFFRAGRDHFEVSLNSIKDISINNLAISYETTCGIDFSCEEWGGRTHYPCYIKVEYRRADEKFYIKSIKIPDLFDDAIYPNGDNGLLEEL